MTKLNLFQRINAVMLDVPYIQKDLKIRAGKGSYSALSHDSVTSALQPAFTKHGLVAVPSIVENACLRYSIVDKWSNTVDRYETQSMVCLTIYNADNPSEKIETRAFAHGFDASDKSPGKAYSMAVKYCYLKLLMMESGDKEEERVEGERSAKTALKSAQVELRAVLKIAGKYSEANEPRIKAMPLNAVIDKINEYKEINKKAVEALATAKTIEDIPL